VPPDLIADRARRAAQLPRDQADAPAVPPPQLDDRAINHRQPTSLNWADSDSGANTRLVGLISVRVFVHQLAEALARGCETERLSRSAIQAVGDQIEIVLIEP
jgi:hypothetical protein